MKPGDAFGPYSLIRQVGHGGMGVVWEAEGPQGRVAVKFIPEFLMTDPALIERMRRETEALKRLSHPGIVRLHEFGLAQGLAFLVMELLKGETLADRLEREAPLPIPEIERIAAALAETLAYLHGRGVIHRDLKPQNVFLTEDGGVKLIDLGVAKVLDEASLTVTGSHFGTPAYMSPESFRDAKSVTAASDVWSLGVILYQAATAQLPFPGTTAASIIAKISDTNITPQSPTRLRPDIPEKLARLIEPCLTRYAYRRPTAAQIAWDLTGQEPRSWRIPPAFRKSRRLTRSLFLLAALIALPYPLLQIVKSVRSGRPQTINLKLIATDVPEVSSGSFPSIAQLPLKSGITSYSFANRRTEIGIKFLSETELALHIDRNRDGDPFNDPGITGEILIFRKPAAGHRRAIWNDLDIENNGLRSTLHADWDEPATGPDVLRLKHNFAWLGKFEIADERYEAILRDYEPDGILTTADRWFVRRMGDQGRISSVNMRKFSESWVMDGRELQLSLKPDGSAELQIGRAIEPASEVALVTNGPAVSLNLAVRPSLLTSYFRAGGVRLKNGRGELSIAGKKFDIRARPEDDTSAILEVNDRTYRVQMDKRRLQEKRLNARFDGIELGEPGMRYDFILSWHSGEDPGQTYLQIHRNFAWVAPVTLDGRPFQIAVLDDQADGVPTIDDQWTLLAPGEPRRVPRDWFRPLSSPWIETDREIRLAPRPDGTVTAQVIRTDTQAPPPVLIERADAPVHLSMVMAAAPMIADNLIDSRVVKVSDSQAHFTLAGRSVSLGITEKSSGRESIHIDADHNGNPFKASGLMADKYSVRMSEWERLPIGDPGMTYRVVLKWDPAGSGAGVLELKPAFLRRAAILLFGGECEIVVLDNDVNGILSKGDRWLARTPEDRWGEIRAGFQNFSESQSVYGTTIRIETTPDGRIRLHVSAI